MFFDLLLSSNYQGVDAMPVSSLQHRNSTGKYHPSSQHTGRRHDFPSAERNESSAAYAQNLRQFTSQLTAIGSHAQRDCYPPPQRFTKNAPAVTAQLLLLLSQIRPDIHPLTQPVSPACSTLDNAGVISPYQEDTGSPGSRGLWQATVLNAANRFISLHDPLKFPAASASVVSPESPHTLHEMYNIYDSNFSRLLFQKLKRQKIINIPDTPGLSPVVIFFPRNEKDNRIKRASYDAIKEIQDANYNNFLTNHCHIRTKTNKGEPIGDLLLVSGETVRNPFRALAEKLYESGTGHLEMPNWLVVFTEGANVVVDVVVGYFTLGAYSIIKYGSAKSLKTSGHAVNNDMKCLRNEFSPEELAALLFDTEDGITHRHHSNSAPVYPKPSEMTHVNAFQPDGFFVHENIVNKLNTVKKMTFQYLGEQYFIKEKAPAEFWASRKISKSSDIIEKRVYFDEVHNKIHFSPDMPAGQGIDYDIIDGKHFINIHGSDHEIIWSGEKKTFEIIVNKKNGETMKIPVYMEPLSKSWHMKVLNDQLVFSEEHEKIISMIKVKMEKDFFYTSTGNKNPDFYGEGRIYDKGKIGDARHHAWGQYIEINGELVAVREQANQLKDVRYEVYNRKSPDNAGYPVYWYNGRWIFQSEAPANLLNDVPSVIKKVKPLSNTISMDRLSAPDKVGLCWDKDGNAFIKYIDHYYKMTLTDNKWYMHITDTESIGFRIKIRNKKFRLNKIQKKFLSTEKK